MFSISASSSDPAWSSASSTSAGMVASPASSAARQRRSPGDELVAVVDRPDDDRLKHAALPDRVRQRGQRRLVEALARLSWIRPDLRDRDVAKPAGDLGHAGYRRCRVAVVSRRQRIVDEQPSLAGRSSRRRSAEQLDHLAVGERDAAVRRQARDRHPCGGRLGDQR